MGLKEYITSGIVLSIIFVSFITFVTIALNENNPASIDAITGNPTINNSFYVINKSLASQQDIAEKQMNATTTSNPFTAIGNIVILSIVGSFAIFSNGVVIVFNQMFVLANYLGAPPIVIGGLSATILISLIFLGWRLIRWAT